MGNNENRSSVHKSIQTLLDDSLGSRIYVANYDEFLRENNATRGLRGLLAHGSSRYYTYPPTGGTYDLTDDPNFS